MRLDLHDLLKNFDYNIVNYIHDYRNYCSLALNLMKRVADLDCIDYVDN